MKNKSLWILASLLCCFLFVFLCVRNSYDEILGMVADYYFKNNNIELAQKYYEASFEKGANNTRRREIYVNSIINSPLTLEAQEKILKFLQNPKQEHLLQRILN
jgi:hypothetical protein